MDQVRVNQMVWTSGEVDPAERDRTHGVYLIWLAGGVAPTKSFVSGQGEISCCRITAHRQRPKRSGFFPNIEHDAPAYALSAVVKGRSARRSILDRTFVERYLADRVWIL